MRIEVIAKIDIGLNNGATTRLLDFCEDLARRHEVRMWLQRARLPPVLKFTPGLEVRLLAAPTPADRADAVKALKAIIYEMSLAVQLAVAFLLHGRSDAIYLREVGTLAPGLISRVFRVPLFMEIDGSPYRDARQRPGPLQSLRAAVLRWQGRLCAGIVTFSEGQREVILQDYGLPGQRVLSISNGADLARFRPSSRDAAIEELALDPQLEYLVWAGSLRPNQEMPVLLSAFARLRARRPSARLILLAPEVDQLQTAAKAAGVAESTFVRHVDHTAVPAYLTAASVCIATSTDTPGGRANAVAPLKLFEYMACGRPAIAADLPWLRFVEEEGLGLVYVSGDPESLAEAMAKLLSLPAADRDAIGTYACAYVQRNHGWADLNARTEAFFRDRILAYKRQGASHL